MVPILLSACSASSVSTPFGSGDSASAVTEDRLLQTAQADPGGDIGGGGASAHCPQVVSWPKDRVITVYQGQTGDRLSVVHQSEITKLARECQLYSDRVIVRYGVAGRVLLGPKGQAGTVTLPVSVRAANADQKTLATDKMNIPTTIPAGNPVGYFSMVKEIAFPIAVGTRPEDYKVFIAFVHADAG